MVHKVGVVGGGQLARMMIPPAIELGIEIGVLSESSESSARVGLFTVGDHRDINSVLEFARNFNVITFDHEQVPQSVLAALDETGIALRPGPGALKSSQDKIFMRGRLHDLGIPQPHWGVAQSAEDINQFARKFGLKKVVVKAPQGGYDGKGVRFMTGGEGALDWLSFGPVLVEEEVKFEAEVAQLIARRPSGGSISWPLVETFQSNGVCTNVVAPAAINPYTQLEAEAIARTIAEGLDVVGVLAVEMFVRESGEIVVNELAMRPHNSGHIFTELSVTSQFEQHLRAILDLPLGATDFVMPYGVMVNVFGGINKNSLQEAMGSSPNLKVHDYRKVARPGRKAGHVSVIGENLSNITVDAVRASNTLSASL